MFKGITRDHLELVRHAEGEFEALYETNTNISEDTQLLQHPLTSPALCLQSICLVDGSWTSDSQYSGYGWVWRDKARNEQILGLQN